MLSRGITNPHTYIRASIRSMETELESSGGRGAGQAMRGRLGSAGGSRGALGGSEAMLGGGRSQSYLQPQEQLGDGSRHSDKSGSGHEGDGAGAAAVVGGGMAVSRTSRRSRRYSTGWVAAFFVLGVCVCVCVRECVLACVRVCDSSESCVGGN